MTTALSRRVSRALRPLFRRRRPFEMLEQDLDDLLSRLEADWNGEWPLGSVAPSLDLSETESALQIRMDVPGLKAEEINVEISGNTVRISGERKEEKEEKGRTYHCVERQAGTFARTVTLPASIQEDKVSAECKDGVLTITMPKTEEAKTRQVKVTPK
jgi:HSP20 family protein